MLWGFLETASILNVWSGSINWPYAIYASNELKKRDAVLLEKEKLHTYNQLHG